jgi:NADH-quinone oxidoreductase subunit J
MEIIFFISGFLIVIASLMVIIFKNPIYSALSLLVSFLGVATFYVLLNAHFLAIIQIIIYAGAIAVLFLFATMLTSIKDELKETRQKTLGKFIGIIASSIIVSIIIISAIKKIITPNKELINLGYVENIGRALLTDYVVPFEIASVLLLVAIIGTIVIAKKTNI